MTCLGLDTSNYTTSVALFDGETGTNCSRLLDVAEGQLGLRQSDALFAHVKRLPELVAQLKAACDLSQIGCVAASTRPRAVEGSYMPCFLAGENLGRCLAQVLGVPFYAVSHQQGHLAAALWSAGKTELMDGSFLAWHLSGGTTELLLVQPGEDLLSASRIGGTSDLAAGQLIDRTGKLLGLRFPAGKALDALSVQAQDAPKPFVPTIRELELSFSGLENKAKALHEAGTPDADVAAFVLHSVCRTVRKVTLKAMQTYPGLPVLFTGGVSSNQMLRKTMPEGIFAEPAYSTDNALGVALLGWRKERNQ